MGQFKYRVNDDNMLGDCIRRGDIVTISETQTFTESDIIAIASEDDISILILRRVTKVGPVYILNSSNPIIETETKEDILVVGKITKVNVIN